MLRISVETSDHGTIFLDVNELSLSLNWQFADISTVGKSKAPHSLSFTLPFTESNDLALTGYRNPATIDVDIRASLDCIVYEDDNDILHGSLNVMSMDLQARKYKCAIYGKAADVYSKLKEARWVDIFTNPDGTIFQGLDHEKTAYNIDQTYGGYDITQGQLGDEKIFYPLQMTYFSDLNSNLEREYYPLSQGMLELDSQPNFNRTWTAKSFCVGVQVSYLLEKIFEYCGLALVYNETMETADNRPCFEALYYMTTPENQTYRPYYSAECLVDYYFSQASGVVYDLEMTGTDFEGAVTFLETTPEYDPDGLFDGVYFEAPQSGVYFFQVTGTWTRAAGTNDNFSIGVMPLITSTGVSLTTQWTNFSADTTTTSGIYQQTFSIYLSAQDQVSFYVQWSQVSTAVPVVFEQGDLSVKFVSYIGQSNTVLVPQSLGDESVGEWFEALMKQYNMALDVNVQDKRAYLYLRRELYDTNIQGAKNWSAKLDRSKPVTLQGNAGDLKRKLTFRHELTDNNFGNWWEEKYKRDWDSWTYRSNKEYTQGEEEIGGYFSTPHWMKVPDGYDNNGALYLDQFDQTAKPNMLMMFKDLEWEATTWKVKPSGNSRFFVYRTTASQGFTPGLYLFDNEEDPTGFLINRHKRAIPYYANNALTWSKKQSYNGLFDTNNKKTLYEVHYEQEVEERYSIDTRILECEMFVNASDLATMTWGDIIQIDTQYYYLESVSNYYVGGNQASKVTLRRLLTSGAGSTPIGQPCTLNIMTVDIDCQGIVTGFDRFGVEVALNEACCDSIGGGNWMWDENAGTCSTGDSCYDASDFTMGRNAGAVTRGHNLSTHVFFDPLQVITSRADAQVITFQLTLSTKGTANELAKNSAGETSFAIAQNVNLGFNVEYIATNTTEANKGDVEFGTWTGVIRAKDFVGDKAGADDVTSRIGDVSPLTIGVQTAVVDDVTSVQFYCGGMEADWLLDVTVTARLIERESIAPTPIVMQGGEALATQAGIIVIEQQ